MDIVIEIIATTTINSISVKPVILFFIVCECCVLFDNRLCKFRISEQIRVTDGVIQAGLIAKTITCDKYQQNQRRNNNLTVFNGINKFINDVNPFLRCYFDSIE